MRRGILAILAVAAATIVMPSVVAHAATPCAPGACITISGTVTGPSGEAVPGYNITVQRADGVSATAVTDAGGHYAASVPTPASASQCYQIVGVADSFYANSTSGLKMCASGTTDLYARVRTQSFYGVQKNYIPDSSHDVVVPIEVQALSRIYPAPFASAPMAWAFGYDNPWEESGHPDADLGEENTGVFGSPSVKQIAAGVWQYVWHSSITLEAGQPGYYDFDWGKRAGDTESAFDPMMECRMFWFGWGTDSLSQSKALPGQVVTIYGRRFGTTPGGIKFKGSGQVQVVSGSGIVSWTDTSVTFAIPPNAKSGWVSVVEPGGLETNGQYLDLDPTKAPLPKP